ncbi:DinB family protein [Tenacibaculum amylolyticum]|uniref:DinB family protein n=1 Tax=Tenacibaculum amylolyticum TaxID=104269 RepID=UPI0038953D83
MSIFTIFSIMEVIINRLEKLIDTGHSYIQRTSVLELKYKPNPKKWSKQEILGHLIDSAINNLQRFTEIQFTDFPYTVRSYQQNELVVANKYQDSETEELLMFWLALNHRIAYIMQHTTQETLNETIIVPNGTMKDVRYLMIDYVDHLEHHLLQITV